MVKIEEYDSDLLIGLYSTMFKERECDEKIVKLLHDGKISGFYHPGKGQEAIGAGCCANLTDDDYLFYDHRGCNQQIAKGISLVGLFGDFMAKINGTTGGLGAGIVHHAQPDKGILGQSGTIGESYVLGVGVGYSIKYRKTDQVCMVFNGEGATARELFHGAMNWSALYDLPVVYIIENNKYAVSTPCEKTHAVKEGGSLAGWAEGYGIPNTVIDGNDVLEVYETTKEAVERARNGEGPTVIEAKTYRQLGHFIGDPADYMDEEELKYWKEEKDPIDNYRKLLLEKGVATKDKLREVEKEVKQEIEKAVEEADKAPLPDEDRMYEDVFVRGNNDEKN